MRPIRPLQEDEEVDEVVETQDETEQAPNLARKLSSSSSIGVRACAEILLSKHDMLSPKSGILTSFILLS